MTFWVGNNYTGCPSLRGEQHSMSSTSNAKYGSPPPVRGARCCGTLLSDATRITPGCAGSTGTCPAAARADPDHPRVRVEHTVTS